MYSIRFLRHTFPIVSILFIALFIASCGSASGGGSSSTTSGGGSTPTATTPSGSTPTATTQSGGSYGNGKGNSTPTAPSGSGAIVHTATATVNGKSVTILTNAKGLTLYYFTVDTQTVSACAAGCSGTWPALLIQGSGQPTSAGSLPGKLSVQTSANGSQVQYNGHFLYTFSGDTAPGQTNGEGIAGKWFVATKTLM